jgi:hypothetical protein
MSMDSFELTNRDGGYQSKPEPPLQPSRLQIPGKVFFVSLAVLVPALTIASVLEIAFTTEGAKRGPQANSGWVEQSPFTQPKNYSQTLSNFPANTFASQDSLKLASASLSLICAVVLGGVAWYAFIKGPIGVSYLSHHKLPSITVEISV